MYIFKITRYHRLGEGGCYRLHHSERKRERDKEREGGIDNWPILCSPLSSPSSTFYTRNQLHLRLRGLSQYIFWNTACSIHCHPPFSYLMFVIYFFYPMRALKYYSVLFPLCRLCLSSLFFYIKQKASVIRKISSFCSLTFSSRQGPPDLDHQVRFRVVYKMAVVSFILFHSLLFNF